MKTVKFSMPLGNRATGEELSRREEEGVAVGPFALHRTPHFQRKWTVSHVATGCVVQEMLPTKKRALWLAKKLTALDVWDFTDPMAAKQIAPDVLGQITTLRADAMHGDCQGSLA